MGKGKSLQQMELGKQDMQMQKNETELYLTSYTNSGQNSLNTHIRCKTVILLEENIGENLNNIDLDNNLLNMTTQAQTTKAKTR